MVVAGALLMVGSSVYAAPSASAATTCDGASATIRGTAKRDFLEGTAGRDVIVGLGGRDWIDGNGGDDVICGGAGDDFLQGGPGADLVVGDAGDDDVEGGPGPDRLRGMAGIDVLTGDPTARRPEDVERANDVIDGGDGSDIVSLWMHRKARGHVVVDIAAGTARGQGKDSLRSVENAAVASAHDDLLLGDSGPNAFWSGDGADLEKGRGGDDLFFAGGDDDRHWGGDGSDTVDMSNADTAVVSLLGGIARSDATGTDQLGSIENVTGSDGPDVITGDAGVNVLDGSGGEDVVRGMAGDDTLRGGSNDIAPDAVDSLAGGAGDDLIDGSAPGLRRDQRDEVDYTGRSWRRHGRPDHRYRGRRRHRPVAARRGRDRLGGGRRHPGQRRGRTSSTAASATTGSRAWRGTTSSRGAPATTSSSGATGWTSCSSTPRTSPSR